MEKYNCAKIMNDSCQFWNRLSFLNMICYFSQNTYSSHKLCPIFEQGVRTQGILFIPFLTTADTKSMIKWAKSSTLNAEIFFAVNFGQSDMTVLVILFLFSFCTVFIQLNKQYKVNYKSKMLIYFWIFFQRQCCVISFFHALIMYFLWK